MKRRVIMIGWLKILGQGWKKAMDCYHDNQEDFYLQELKRLEERLRETTNTHVSSVLLPADESPSFGGILNGR